MSKYRQVMNRMGLMLCGAVLGLVIVNSIMGIRETWLHTGPGFVSYGDPDHDEWTEKVPESQYKRHKYTEYEVMLGIGLFLWFIVAFYGLHKTPERLANNSED